MTDAAFARLLGSLVAVVGLVGGGLAWSHDWTLFVPFALVLVGFGMWLQILALIWRVRK